MPQSTQHQSAIGGFFTSLFSSSKERRAAPKGGGARNHQFRVEGQLVRGRATEYAVGSMDIVIDNDTWIFGDIRLNCHVTVQGVHGVNNEHLATKITIR